MLVWLVWHRWGPARGAAAGGSAGVPVVLLHGFPDDVHAYDAVAPALAATVNGNQGSGARPLCGQAKGVSRAATSAASGLPMKSSAFIGISLVTADLVGRAVPGRLRRERGTHLDEQADGQHDHHDPGGAAGRGNMVAPLQRLPEPDTRIAD